MLLYGKAAPVQLPYLLQHLLHKLLAEGYQLLRLVVQVLQLVDDLGLQIENGALQGHLVDRGLALAHAEELEITAQVEDIELAFILSIHQTVAEARAAAYHLPELRLAHDLLEKH